MKVVSSIDTRSETDGYTERQFGDESALVAQDPVDSYGIARSPSAGRCNRVSSFAVGPSVDSAYMDALPPQCFFGVPYAAVAVQTDVLDEMDATITEFRNCTQTISDDDFASSDDCVVVVANNVPAGTSAHKRAHGKKNSIVPKTKAKRKKALCRKTEHCAEEQSIVPKTAAGDEKAAKYELKKRKSKAYHRAKKQQLQKGASEFAAAAAAQQAYSECQ